MKGNGLLSLGLVVSFLVLGCGGSPPASENTAETIEYRNAVITSNTDASLTISDGQRSSEFTTLKYGDTPSGEYRAMAPVQCTCTGGCSCSSGVCVCTGCSGSCPP